MAEPDFRTLEQRLIARLFPSNPPSNFAEAYGVRSIGDLIVLDRFGEEMLNRIKRMCDLNPAGAPDLIRLITDVYDLGLDEGRGEGYDDAVNSESATWVARGKAAERERLREQLSRIVGGLTV
jgi:hypothetical protein